jgi:hypothetical protein
MEQLTEPNDLLHLFYKYGVGELPISREGDITGKLVKSSVVRYLNRSENFDSNIVTTIDNLVEPVEEAFFDRLKEDLREGSIKGIPIVRENGELEQIVTPGVLDAREEASEFVDESKKREMYEQFLEEVPFSVALFSDGERLFENRRWKNHAEGENSSTMTWTERDLTVKLRMPDVVKELLDGLDAVSDGDSVSLRDLLTRIETRLMEKARERTDSVSEAADTLELPRQTFNYRWEKRQEDEAS